MELSSIKIWQYEYALYDLPLLGYVVTKNIFGLFCKCLATKTLLKCCINDVVSKLNHVFFSICYIKENITILIVFAGWY